MIRYLDGTHETVDYQTADTQICLYLNNEYENYPPHWHTSFEVIMPLRSGYRVVIGEQEYSLREGDLLFICPNVVHELFAPPEGERIIFQPDLSHISIKELNLLLFSIRPALLVTPEEYPEIIGGLRSLLLSIQQEYDSQAPYAEASIFSRFIEMLVLIGRNQPGFSVRARQDYPVRYKDYMDKFLYLAGYIDQHYAQDLTLEEVAGLAGFSKYHFSRLFKAYTGTTFYKYLNQKRIDQAKTYLADPSLTVIEVASRSGFSSLSAFMRYFRQVTHCTPTEFRSMKLP